MSNVKPYLIIAVLVGTGFLIYGLAFLSSKVAPSPELNSGQLMLAVTETIVAVGVCIAAVLGCMYYIAKKQFNQPQHRHQHQH